MFPRWIESAAYRPGKPWIRQLCLAWCRAGFGVAFVSDATPLEMSGRRRLVAGIRFEPTIAVCSYLAKRQGRSLACKVCARCADLAGSSRAQNFAFGLMVIHHRSSIPARDARNVVKEYTDKSCGLRENQ